MNLDERQLLRAPFRAGGRGLDGGDLATARAVLQGPAVPLQHAAQPDPPARQALPLATDGVTPPSACRTAELGGGLAPAMQAYDTGGTFTLGHHAAAAGLGLAQVRLQLLVSTPYDCDATASVTLLGSRRRARRAEPRASGPVPDQPDARTRARRIAAADQLLAELGDLPPELRRRYDHRAQRVFDQVLAGGARMAHLARAAGAAEAAGAAAAVDVLGRPAVTATVRRRPANRRSRLSHPSRWPVTQRTTLTAAAGGNARGRYTYARQ